VEHLAARERGRVGGDDRVGIGEPVELAKDVALEVDGAEDEDRALCVIGGTAGMWRT
jgi:hypothetical protein